MRAELKGFHSADVYDLKGFKPEGAFGLLVDALIGPQGEPGMDQFSMTLCTPEWFAARRMPADGFTPGRHCLFVKRYDYAALRRFLEELGANAVGETWDEIAEKIGRIGKWEFEDYVEYVPHKT